MNITSYNRGIADVLTLLQKVCPTCNHVDEIKALTKPYSTRNEKYLLKKRGKK